MQHAIDIPAPAGADNETVSTALETAALFRAKGDGQEAMRWLRRAAESAGEAGDDERALSLSRVVADLHDELERPPAPSPAAPYPPPPSARAAQPGASGFRTSHPPPPSSRLSRPPLSSTRASTPPRPSARPSYSRPPSVRPMAETPAPSSAPSPAPSPAPSLAVSVAEPARVVTLPSVAAPAPSAPPSVAALPTKGARHAARVAIEISTTKPGVFEARLLADGEAPRIGSTEALLVLLDPASHLLER
jgi:hypothetical protein